MSGSLFGSLDVVVGAGVILVVEVDVESLVLVLVKDVVVLELLVVNPGVVSWLVAAEVVAVVSSLVWVVWPSVVVPAGVSSVVPSAVWLVSWLVAAEVVAVVSSSVWVVWPSVVVPAGDAISGGHCCGNNVSQTIQTEVDNCCLFFGLGQVWPLGRCPSGCAISGGTLLWGGFLAVAQSGGCCLFFSGCAISGTSAGGGFLAGGGRSGSCCLFFGLGGLALGRCPSGCAISGGTLLSGWFPGWWQPKWWLLSLLRSEGGLATSRWKPSGCAISRWPPAVRVVSQPAGGSRSGGCCLFFSLGGLALGHCPSEGQQPLCCWGGFLAGNHPDSRGHFTGWHTPRSLSQGQTTCQGGFLAEETTAEVVAVVHSSAVAEAARVATPTAEVWPGCCHSGCAIAGDN